MHLRFRGHVRGHVLAVSVCITYCLDGQGLLCNGHGIGIGFGPGSELSAVAQPVGRFGLDPVGEKDLAIEVIQVRPDMVERH